MFKCHVIACCRKTLKTFHSACGSMAHGLVLLTVKRWSFSSTIVGVLNERLSMEYCSTIGQFMVYCSTIGQFMVYCSTIGQLMVYCSTIGHFMVYCSTIGQFMVYCSTIGQFIYRGEITVHEHLNEMALCSKKKKTSFLSIQHNFDTV